MYQAKMFTWYVKRSDYEILEFFICFLELNYKSEKSDTLLSAFKKLLKLFRKALKEEPLIWLPYFL